MISLKKEIEAIHSRFLTPDNPWGSGRDYCDKVDRECEKLWGITDKNRREYINDCGVFIHRSHENYTCGHCKVEISISQAPNAMYAWARSYHVGTGGSGFSASVSNTEAYFSYAEARIAAIQNVHREIANQLERLAVSHKPDALKMLALLNNEQQPSLL